MLKSAAGLDDLRSFFMIADCGGISAASRQTGMSKSTLSRALSRLEERAGTPLFDRVGNGVRLTRAGEDVLTAAQQATEAGAAADEILRSATEEPRGRLRIVTSAASAQLFLAPILAQLIADYPGIQPHISISIAGPDPLSDDFDVVLRLGRPKEPYLIARRIAETPMKLFGPKGFAARFDLRDHDVVARLPRIALDEEPAFRDWTLTDASGQEIRMVSEPVGFAGDPMVALALVSADVGVTLLPEAFGDEWIQQSGAIGILPGFSAGNAGLFAVFPPGRSSIPAVRVLIDRLARFVNRFREEQPQATP